MSTIAARSPDQGAHDQWRTYNTPKHSRADQWRTYSAAAHASVSWDLD